MKTTSPRKKFCVFEFNEEDELIERTSRKTLSKYKNPREPDDTSVTKYKFLQCFARGTKARQKDFKNEPLDVDAMNDTVNDGISGLDATAPSGSSNYKPVTHYSPNYLDTRSFFSGASSYAARAQNLGVTSTGSNHLDSTLPHFLSDNELVGINLGDDDRIELSSSSSSASDLADDEGPLEKQGPECGFSGRDIETLVVVSPDYISYGDIYCSESRLTFSCSFLKLECSTVDGNKEPSIFEWTIADIVNIESQWCELAETAIVNLRLESKDKEITENAKSSGIVELKFAVLDPHWLERQEAIKSLNEKYKDIWNVVFDLNETFEDVIYPKGDLDAVSISKTDVQLLQPKTFINDTIIDFYITYLKNKVKPEEKHRFHFFNTFFFRKLADLDKDPSRACEGRAAFQRVRKWTRKVDIFEKDYIFIPVNFSFHWSLIVICHPGEVINLKDEEIEKSPKVPCILHMDSIKGSHRGLKNLIQSYLLEEWKERHDELVEDVSSKFLNLRFVPLQLPQQENSFDCGLFLLHYVELFVEQAPVNFSPFSISKFSDFLNKDWFPPAEASLKRAYIKKLIFEMVEDNSRKVCPSACDVKYSFEFTDINEESTSIEFLDKICNSMETCPGSYSNFNADQEFDITPMAANPLQDVHCFGEPELVFQGLFKPGDRARSLTHGNYQPFEQKVFLNQFKDVLSPIEEDEETGEQTVCSPTAEAGISVDIEEYERGDRSAGTSIVGSPISSDFQANQNYAAEEFLASCPEEGKNIYELSSTSSEKLDDCVVEDSQEENGTNDVDECEKGNRSSGTPIGGPSVSSKVQMNQNYAAEEFLASNLEEDKNIYQLSSSSSERLADCIVEDSLEENVTNDVNEYENSHSSGRILTLSNQETDSIENTNLTANHMPPASELEWQGAKRLRLRPPTRMRCAKRSRLMLPATRTGRRRRLSSDLHRG